MFLQQLHEPPPWVTILAELPQFAALLFSSDVGHGSRDLA